MKSMFDLGDRVIDAREPVRCLTRSSRRVNNVPLLTWDERWAAADGLGLTLGLLDGAFLESHPDIVTADVSVRHFATTLEPLERVSGHTLHAVAMLVGQGAAQIRGVVPRARLLVASVI